MDLERVKLDKELVDGRTYLCCRSSRHGNAIWETLEAQKHLLISHELKLGFGSFSHVFHLPGRVDDVGNSHL